EHPELPEITVEIRRNRRARHVRLNVDEHSVVTASIPTRFSLRQLDEIVRDRTDWLHDVLLKMQLKAKDTEVDLERGDPIRWLGAWYPTALERAGKRPVVTLAEDRLTLRVPESSNPWDALI